MARGQILKGIHYGVTELTCSVTHGWIIQQGFSLSNRGTQKDAFVTKGWLEPKEPR